MAKETLILWDLQGNTLRVLPCSSRNAELHWSRLRHDLGACGIEMPKSERTGLGREGSDQRERPAESDSAQTPQKAAKQKPCSEEQGFAYFQYRVSYRVGAREIDGRDSTKVTGSGEQIPILSRRAGCE
jgi:hypothetical protein